MRFFGPVGFLLSLAAPLLWADFSYQSTVKSGVGAGTVSKFKVKGGRMRMDSGTLTIITDLDTKTVTTINHTSKTYTVQPLDKSQAAMPKTGMPEVKAQVNPTGQSKRIGNYNCQQVMVTMSFANSNGAMSMESEMWVSPDVPGNAEMRALGAKMADAGFVTSMMDDKNRAMMIDLQRQMAKLNGMPVLQIMRMKSGSDAQAKKMADQMAAVREQMEKLKKQGGPRAEAAAKTLALLPAPGGKYLLEVATESSAFSAATIAASEFAIPAGYKKADR